MISRLTGGCGLALLVSGLGLGGLTACLGESVVGSGGGQSTTTSTGGGTTSAGGQSTSGSTGGTGTSAAGGAGGSGAGGSSSSGGGSGGQSTSTGGGGSGGTTGTMTSTGSGVTTQECKDCVQAQCAAGIGGGMCNGLANPECAGWLVCWSGCDQTSCHQGCDQQYPQFADVQKELYTCICGTCEALCASGPGGCVHIEP